MPEPTRFRQRKSNTYSAYGAQIDDSTQFQVYNNVEPDEKTAQAVQETYGKMLYYDGNPITAYYFSTSCGTTTNAAIWDSDPEDTALSGAGLSLADGQKPSELCG